MLMWTSVLAVNLSFEILRVGVSAGRFEWGKCPRFCGMILQMDQRQSYSVVLRKFPEL